jgi:glutathione S-transferase
MSAFRFYYGNGACSFAPHVALEEAGADFEPVLVALGAFEQRTPEYRRINPKGRVPALARGDWVLTEVPAILRYVALTHPEAKLWPAAPELDARCAEWLAWLSSTVHPAYSHISRAERYVTTPAGREEAVVKGRENCRELCLDIERRIGRGPWALGEDYSVADPYLLVVWTWGRLVGSTTLAVGLDPERELPNWTAHARRMTARPAVRRAIEREGLQFPW